MAHGVYKICTFMKLYSSSPEVVRPPRLDGVSDSKLRMARTKPAFVFCDVSGKARSASWTKAALCQPSFVSRCPDLRFCHMGLKSFQSLESLS